MTTLEYLGNLTATTLQEGGVRWPSERQIMQGAGRFSWNAHDLLELSVYDTDHVLQLEFDSEQPAFDDGCQGAIFSMATGEKVDDVLEMDRICALADYMFKLIGEE